MNSGPGGLVRLVGRLYAAFDVDAAADDVAALCGHDRYQASAGIAAAADHVAARAEAAGLADVRVLRLPADGMARWWTFRGPPAWTPVHAELRLGGTPLLRYPDQPYALAAHSAPTPPTGRSGRLLTWSDVDGGADPADAVVVLDRPDVPLPSTLDRLAGCGAVALVADPLAGRPERWPDQRGRIELPAGSRVAAFSATAAELGELCRAAASGGTATVVVRLGPAAHLPVVVARLPGDADSDGELLLSAHLCHPAPSANDNASGVAALLGVARAAAAVAVPDGPPLRFVWGPEFVGMAAYLHSQVHTGRSPRPVAAVNVDMAGEDQRRCGGPLVVERAPDELPSYLSALAERCVALLPQAARSYSGAVACDTWAWRATPHVGASDHALPAAPPTGCPAVGLGHWPDRTNHTSADTLDLLDVAELRRTATVAGAALLAARAAHTDRALAAELVDTTVSLAAAHLLAALPGAGPAGRAASSGGGLDPWAVDQAARLLAHRAAVAAGSLRSLAALGVPEETVARAVRWADGLAGLARGRLPAGPAPEPPPGRDDTTVLAAAFDGPPNLRELAARAPAADRAWIADRLADDRGGGYARMLALLRGADGHRDRRSVAWWAALAGELPVAVPFADRFLDAAVRAGWLAPADGAAEPGAPGTTGEEGV